MADHVLPANSFSKFTTGTAGVFVTLSEGLFPVRPDRSNQWKIDSLESIQLSGGGGEDIDTRPTSGFIYPRRHC